MKPGIKRQAKLLMIRNKQKSNKKQNGLALLVLVIAIALTLSAYYFSSISAVDVRVDNLEHTRKALKQAKQALINYASMNAYGLGGGKPGEYGHLPCTFNSQVNEGQQDGNCNNRNKNNLAYLPWVSLQSNIFRDGSGNCLWYAVSGSYKNSPFSGMINEDTNGMFEIVDAVGTVIDGINPQDRIVAVIIAPGAALNAQSRNYDATTGCGDDAANPAAYLEGNGFTDNAALSNVADRLDQFLHATLTSHTEAIPYNDYFITITREEIWRAILDNSDFNNKMEELTEVLALCLSKYSTTVAYDRLPWPAPMDLADYRIAANYNDIDNSAVYAGRLPFIVDDSNNKINGATNIELFEQGNCSMLGAVTADLTDSDDEYRTLWENWKDHFFYIVSKGYAPDDAAASCGNCIEFNGNDMAAIVIYSGSPLAGQVRTGPEIPGDANSKDEVSNYIENNSAVFDVGSGSGNYVAGGNDIMFCIKTDFSVSKCM